MLVLTWQADSTMVVCMHHLKRRDKLLGINTRFTSSWACGEIYKKI
jgi:hypothetical protein